MSEVNEASGAKADEPAGGSARRAPTVADFTTGAEARWCPGCGDHAILSTMRGLLPALGVAPENTVVVSGIGCSSRLPYYLDTYGIHSIHGRAPSFATGISINRPDLSVWVVTGDGDALSIGGNHLIHALRRNVNLKILLFNNHIYGLTKGQHSPTSKVGTVSPSSPHGSLDNPFNPIALALGAGATFVARTLDSDRRHLTATLTAAAAHQGAALVEIRQGCPTFTPIPRQPRGSAAPAPETDNPAAPEQGPIRLSPGLPIVFGTNEQWGVIRDPSTGELAIGHGGDSRVVVHDPGIQNSTYAYALARLAETSLAEPPIGVYRSVTQPSFDQLFQERLATARPGGRGELRSLLTGVDSWEVAAS
ncbi:2-oxoglutarate oxidoreductase subunit KorB [Frankia canadensis]|uniref:2-oxoglutarate oxidoreductase subunit KorB n=1 Tax=Frankia canadensis TaxID=1836972 RepID=A0A2I2KYQ7_9ACTN|nr:2-oxoacid:ferredoxin oxidoreductase subunit beta [Frankia canadensis]SNQ50790.1 2-oxoglutarate oxidoreductase subunit KorB [Frankia canadensis]SOU58080.1 2-oxoglutarate oxidoreductase subunit KorB [Frankia canadensis]